jgi:hypothetical protein
MTVGKPKETAKTLRDDIAMVALGKLLYPADTSQMSNGSFEEAVLQEHATKVAKIAYAIADAMLRVRLERR